MKRIFRIVIVFFILVGLLLVFNKLRPASKRQRWVQSFVKDYVPEKYIPPISLKKCEIILSKTRDLIKQKIVYDPSYVKLSFPAGDVSQNKGVCADMIVRGMRATGKDLQKLINKDMQQNFSLYPQLWSLSGTDSSIDHRRVPNLMVYFQRQKLAQKLSTDNVDYAPCDIVAWDLGNGITHIGWVSDQRSQSGDLLILHHIGGNPKEENVLHRWSKIGHFRLQYER